MPTASEAIDAAIREVTTARSLVSKTNSKQIRGVDAIASLKATALSWFNTHRPIVTAARSDLDLSSADEHYTAILNSKARYAARQTYLDSLLDVKKCSLKCCQRYSPLRQLLTGQMTLRPISRRWLETQRCAIFLLEGGKSAANASTQMLI